uniref:ABC transporter permease n=1 Tax=Phenylobacterium glaciei TaxID=2803784 RepID=A0A974P1V2_9CAUL|nr:ABC transporter permease [Phenylobacterium glaciei]
MLAMMALLTGGFLVYSAQSLSVARRRPQFALLRVLGLERRGLLAQVFVEGALVGGIGAVLGLALGLGVAFGTLRFLGGDLGGGYFRGTTPDLAVTPCPSWCSSVLAWWPPWLAACFRLLRRPAPSRDRAQGPWRQERSQRPTHALVGARPAGSRWCCGIPAGGLGSAAVRLSLHRPDAGRRRGGHAVAGPSAALTAAGMGRRNVSVDLAIKRLWARPPRLRWRCAASWPAPA